MPPCAVHSWECMCGISYQTVCVVHLIRLVFLVYLIRCVVPDGVYSVCYQTAFVLELIRLLHMVHLIRPYVWYRTSYEAVRMVYLIRLHMLYILTGRVCGTNVPACLGVFLP